jgi:hypothetical protein
MVELHAIGATVVTVAAGVFTLATGAFALRGGSPVVEWLRRAMLAVVGFQVAVGAIVYLLGHRPHESLHLVYGLVAIGVLPLASSFAEEAPPGPRAWVLAVAGVLLIALGWRLSVTG